VEADNLPRISGPQGQSAPLLAMYRLLLPEFEPLDATVERLELTDRGSWRIQLDGGTVIELGRGTPPEIIERTRRYVSTVGRATALYRRKPDAVELADLRHGSGYALRLNGVTTITGEASKDAPKPSAPVKKAH
jgi:cell division protein FtsQ